MFKSVLTYCLVVFFTFLFAGDPSVIGGRTTINKDFTVLSSSYSFANLVSPHDLPFKSTPAPKERQVPNEYESEEDFDDDRDPSVGGHSPESPFNISFGEITAQPLTFSIQNRSTVPFFILYHSWKSFLS